MFVMVEMYDFVLMIEYFKVYVSENFDMLVVLIVDYSMGGLIIGVRGDYCWIFSFLYKLDVFVFIMVKDIVGELLSGVYIEKILGFVLIDEEKKYFDDVVK